MGGEVRYPHEEALMVARRFLKSIDFHVQNAVIVGSLRRQKPDVGDIEILYKPLFQERETGLFGDGVEVKNLSFIQLTLMRNAGTLVDRVDKNNRCSFGPRYQRVSFEGIPLDLFACYEPADWGVLQLIRTGPADFSHRIVTPKSQGGRLPLGMYVKDGGLWDRGTQISIPTEEAFFEAIGMDYIEPEDRR